MNNETFRARRLDDGMWVEGGMLKQNKDMEEKTWFEVRVKARCFLVEADTVEEARVVIFDIITPVANRDIKITKSNITEVIIDEISKGRERRYYLCKLTTIKMDRKTGHRDKTSICNLVLAENFDMAEYIIKKELPKYKMHCEINSITEVDILGIYGK